MPVALKSKEERVMESVKLLRQLKEIGILETCEGYIELKGLLDKWVTGGEAWKGKVRFVPYGRVADIVLPAKEKTYASIMLRAI